MNCLLYHDGDGGAKAREIAREFEFYYEGTTKIKFNILVTSYELFLADLHHLAP
jgi:hypothetical protein